jgi:hypothetical protein
VDRHSKVAGEATGASFTFTLASRAASASATFASAAAFEMPHSESLSQLSQCVREHGVVDTVPSDTRFSLALLLDGVSVFSFEY